MATAALPPCLSEETKSEEVEETSSEEFERVESELTALSEGVAKEALDLGQSLISQIRTEEDYPPDYLNNVEEKVNHLQEALRKVSHYIHLYSGGL